MIVLPIGPAPAEAPATSAPARTEAKATLIKLLALGFTPAERKLIQGVVSLSQRRSMRLDLVGSDAWTTADAILLDGADDKVVAWAAGQPQLCSKVVIWVDARQGTAENPTHLKRPVQWPTLPALLQRALGMDISESARQPLAAH